MCPFKSNSQADFLFHEVLHTDPIPVNNPETKIRKSLAKYKCPVCSKIFKKSSLRCHIRLHCNERPFQCEICKASYARKCNLDDHIKTQHEGIKKSTENEKSVCKFCGYQFSSK